MATFPQIAFTNMENTQRSGVFRCLVPWSTGDIPNLAYLRANKQVEFDGVNRDTYWTTFGPDHRDGSVRWSVAEFEAEIGPGAGVRVQPDVVATVVDGANTTPTPDFSEFDAYWATADVNISYTEPNNGQTYTLSLLTVARAGANNATYTETTLGMRKIIRAEAYFGRGTHNELERASGFDTNSAVVSTTGNVHAELWFEVSSGQRWGTGVLRFSADAQYPSPSEPPDGGARNLFDHARPTRLDPNNGEELDDPLTLEFGTGGITVEFANSAGSTADYQSTRLWYTANVDTGASRWGQHPATDPPARRTFTINLRALGHAQGWPIRFATAWECQTQTTAAQAQEIALRPYTYLGMPTQATWQDTVRTGAMPSPWNGDTVSIKGGWDMPLLEVPQATIDQWYSEGQQRYNNFVGSRPITVNGRLWEWDLIGGSANPIGQGAQRQLGQFRLGRTWLANSPWDLYIQGAGATRELGGARGARFWKQENQTSMWDGADLSSTVWFTGTNLHWTSRDAKGILRGFNVAQSRSQHGSWYNGSVASISNPSLSELTPTQAAFHTWRPWDHGHFGMWQGYGYYLLTQDQFTLETLEETAVVLEGRQIYQLYFGRNPASSTTRAEARIHRGLYHAWLATGKDRYRLAVTRRMTQYTTGTVGSNSPFHRWNQWPVLSDEGATDMASCDALPAGRVTQGPFIAPWQAAHYAVWAMSMAMEWAQTNSTQANILARLARVAIQTIVEQCCMVGPGELSAGAQRAIDNCWDNVVLVRANEPGQVNALQSARYGMGKFYLVSSSNNDAWSLQTDITNVTNSLLPSNGGQNMDIYPALLAYEVFADLRADADFVERVEFLIRRVAAHFGTPGVGPLSYDEDTSKGYGCDRWVSNTFAPPIPRFVGTPRQGLTPLEVAFDATTSTILGDRGSAVLSWWYDWDGSSATPDLTGSIASNPSIETPTHTYTSAGSYRVRLRIEDSAGQATDLDIRDYILASSTVGAAPVADFTADYTSGSAPLSVQFSDQSSPTATSWNWRAEDPSTGDVYTSTERDPVINFLTAGTFDVTLRAANAWGTGLITKTGYITVTSATAPTASFTVSPASGIVPPEITITFDNTSTNATYYSWDFGDGTTSTSAEPGTHEYSASGSYEISLIAYNDIGEWDQATYTLTLTVASVSQDATVTLYDALFPLSRQDAPTISANSSGREVVLGSMIEASAFNSDDDGSFATPTVNPGVTVELEFTDADVGNSIMFTPDSVGVTLQSASVAIGDGQFPGTTQYGPTVFTSGNHVEVRTGDMITATSTQHAPTVTAGTGRTALPGPIFTTASQHDPTGQVIVDRDIELGMIQSASATYSLASGTISQNVQASAQFASATQDDPAATVNGPGVFATYQSGTAVMFSPTASGNVTAAADISILRGSLEAAASLTGSV